MWTVGTDLRVRGEYRWPPIAEGPVFGPEAVRYPAVSTVIQSVCGDPDVAHAAWVAMEARRLFALHVGGMMASMPELVQVADGHWVREVREVPPSELITDEKYLRTFGFRMSGRAADRGTVVHRLLRHWHIDGPVHNDDLPYWVEDAIAEGDGSAPYRCDADETVGYCRTLARWLSDARPQIIATEVPGFYGGERGAYACTLDAIMEIDGEPWIVDLKTSRQSSRHHALQLMAQREVQWIGIPGTADRMEAFPRCRVANLLVQPSGSAFREMTETSSEPWWGVLRAYYGLFGAQMPYKTISRAASPQEEQS